MDILEVIDHLNCHGHNLYQCQYCDYINHDRKEIMTHLKILHQSQFTNENQSGITIIREKFRLDVVVDENTHKKGTL